MAIISSSTPKIVAFVALLLLVGCVAVQEERELIPLTDEEIAFLQKLDDPKNASVIVDVPILFFRLNNLLEEWQTATINKDSWKDKKIQSDLGGILTRYVYLNFDKILNELEYGPQPNRVTAAAALGFCRIPETKDFPQVYPLAIQALLRCLDSGDDSITQNALLGLALLAVEDTPIETILPLMTQHHNPEVRSNAALCLSTITSPKDNDAVMPYVLPALRDDDPKVRCHAILVLENLEDRSAGAALIDLLDDKYEIIRVNAARALGNLGDMDACPKLIENLEHVKESVRFYCHQALLKLTQENFGTDKEAWTEWLAEQRMN